MKEHLPHMVIIYFLIVKWEVGYRPEVPFRLDVVILLLSLKMPKLKQQK